MKWTVRRALGLGLLCAASAQGGSYTNSFNFSSSTNLLDFGGSLWDGVTTAQTGSAAWIPSGGAGPSGSTANGPVGGVAGDGYLQLTLANASCPTSLAFSSYLCGGVLFDDFDNGLAVGGFSVECDLRIGNGEAAPADGFSINFVRSNDPILTALAAGDSFPQMNERISANGGRFSDNGNGVDISLMEEGTTTGLSVGFDLWDSGNYIIPPVSPAVGVVGPGLTYDNVGLDIRLDNVLLTTVSMPNGTIGAPYDDQGNAVAETDPNGNNAATDWTAIETGPYDGTGCDSTLSWVHLKVDLSTNGVLNVWWKNHQIVTNLPTGFAPSPGRLLMAARVGGNTANIEVDNVQITTIPLGSNAPPVAPMVTQPPRQIVAAGDTAVFSVAAAGTPPLSYQWWFNNTSLTGATTAILVLSNVQPAQAGDYFAVVSNTFGSVTSAPPAALTVLAVTPPLTWTNPAPIIYGTALGPGQLNATASVPGTFVYLPPGGVLSAGADVLSVVFTPSGSSVLVTGSVVLVVLQAPLIVTADNLKRPYGTANPPLTGTITGLTSGDDITVTYSCAATVASPAGTYAIVPSLADPNNRLGNYALTVIDGTLTVMPPSIAQDQFVCTTNNGTITITGYSGSGGAVSIPSTINGLPVIALGLEAFGSCRGLTSVTIPDGVTSLGSNAFNTCTSLASVTIPDSVTNIGDGAFSGCTSLTSVTIPGRLTSIGNGVFSGCASLTSIAIPTSVTSIGVYAFYICSSLTSVTIPSSVASIGLSAFGDCYSLKGVFFQGNAPSADSTAFSGDTATAYYLPGTTGWGATFAGLPTAALEFNYAISGGAVTITGYTGPGGAVAVPSAISGLPVTGIAGWAFANSGDLTSVAIPGTVSSIGPQAFANCPYLRVVSFQGNAPSADSTAFSGDAATAYYLPGTTGWGAWVGGIPAVMLAFNYSVSNGAITITGYTGPGGAVTIPATINGLPVTGIGAGAFEGSTNLTSAVVAGTVSSIGPQAFANCPRLTVVFFQGNAPSADSTAFSGDTATAYYLSGAAGWGASLGGIATAVTPFDYLVSGGAITITAYTGPGGAVAIPSAIGGLPVTTIANQAFVNCSSLGSMTIPDSVTNIGDYAFDSCTRLSSVILPAGLTRIGAWVFYSCNSLTNVPIPSSVTSIGDFAFGCCVSLTAIDLPDTVTNIGLFAFQLCSGLAGITIPASLTSLAQGVFSDCSSLTNVTIPDTITNIEYQALDGCASLRAIAVGPLNPFYCSVDGVLFDKARTTLVQFPPARSGDYAIPNSVTEVGPSAFDGCSGLTGVTMSDTLASIDGTAFASCTGLTSVSIPDSVTSLGDWGFYGCTSLTNVTLSSGLTSIRGVTFGGCASLPNITIPAAITNIGIDAFIGCQNLRGVYFLGNAPSLDEEVFYDDDNATVYYMPGTTGWGATFGGLPTMLWQAPASGATATATVVDGFVAGASITGGGYGYTNPPTVLIQGGGGTGATAIAVVSNGVVADIIITDAGTGYTSTPNVYIGLPSGTVNALVLAAGTNSGVQFSQVLLPIQASRCTNILTFQFSLHWDPTVATFVDVEQFGLPGLGAGSFGTGLTNSGILTVSWDDPTGVGQSLGDGTAVFAMRFALIGSAGAASSVTLDGTPTTVEAANSDLALLPVQTVPGQLSVAPGVVAAGRVMYYPTNYPASSPSAQGVAGVTVSLAGAANCNQVTAADGSYSLAGVLSPCAYEVTLAKPDDTPPANGVTTLDIALIRRQILGLAPLDSPYKLLAADVNASGTVTTLDIALIRRLILGLTNTFPIGLWRFVPADYVFPDASNPWGAPANRCYTNLAACMTEQDYVAIKLGDVNNSWVGPAETKAEIGKAESRNLAPDLPGVRFEAGSQVAQRGESVAVPVRVSGFHRATSAQFSLGWDARVLRYAGVGAFGVPGLGAENFGTVFAEGGKLAFSWDDPAGTGLEVANGTALFTVYFDVIGSAGSVSPVTFGDAPTVREASVDLAPGAFAGGDGQVMVVGDRPVISCGGEAAKGTFRISVPSIRGRHYLLESADSLSGANWRAVGTIIGDGTVKVLPDPTATNHQRFYRVRVE